MTTHKSGGDSLRLFTARKLFFTLCAALLFCLTNCQGAGTSQSTQPLAQPPATSATTSNAQVSGQASAGDEFLITPQQVGRVRLQMTVREVKQLFPTATFRLTTLPDTPSIVAVKQPNAADDLLYFNTERMDEKLPGDDEKLTQIMTRNPQHKTAAGIGHGSTIDDAVKAYGAVKLYYSPDVEYAKFAQAPASEMAFWVAAPAGKKSAGVYRMVPAELSEGYYQSSRFNAGATISYISIAAQTKPDEGIEATSSQVAQAFRSILPQIKKQTRVPVLLPGELPSALARRNIYAKGKGTPEGYEITLTSRPDCGANSCFIGSFEAKRGEQPSFKREVQLAGNIKGYYQPLSCGGSCSPPVIEWISDGVLYHIQLDVQWRTKLNPEEEERAMIEVANSAIESRSAANNRLSLLKPTHAK